MTEMMRVAKSEYTRYSLFIGILMILSVGILGQLPIRNHLALKKSMHLINLMKATNIPIPTSKKTLARVE